LKEHDGKEDEDVLTAISNAKIEWFQGLQTEQEGLAAEKKAVYDEAKAQLDFQKARTTKEMDMHIEQNNINQ